MKFEPGPYSTDEQVHKWRGAARSLSLDDTGEEDITTSRIRNARIHEQAESVRLSKTQVQNETSSKNQMSVTSSNRNWMTTINNKETLASHHHLNV